MKKQPSQPRVMLGHASTTVLPEPARKPAPTAQSSGDVVLKWPSEAEMAERQAEVKAYKRSLRARDFSELCPTEFLSDPDPNWQPRLPSLPTIDWRCFNLVQKWQYGPTGLLLNGLTGLGKSWAIWRLLHRLAVEEAREVLALRPFTFGAKAESLLEVGRGRFSEWISEMSHAEVLFLDDLGQVRLVGTKDDYARSMIFAMLDDRVNERRPTFFTTNLNSGELSAAFGESRGDPFVRRIIQSCDVIRFGVSVEDQRGASASHSAGVRVAGGMGGKA